LQAAPSPESYGFISCKLSGDSYRQPLQLRFAGGAICAASSILSSGLDLTLSLRASLLASLERAQC